MNKAPVTISAPDESKKPPWLTQAVERAAIDPEYDKAGVWTQTSRSGLLQLKRDVSKSTSARPAQFGCTWALKRIGVMTWFDLWSACRDATAEEQAVAAIERFGSQVFSFCYDLL